MIVAMSGEPDGETVAERLLGTLGLLVGSLPAGWLHPFPGGTSVFTGAPVPTLNGVWAVTAGAGEDEVQRAVDAVQAGAAVPYCLQARPSIRATAAQVAERRGMQATDDIPLMTAVGPVSGPEPRELAIRRLEATESRLHAEIAGEAFDAPPEVFTSIVNEATFALPELRAYAGDINGLPVCTAIAARVQDSVGVFNVATAPEHRGRGYGAAVTARAIADSGAAWSWLQSSELGYGVYERLGFRTVEHWACWIAA